MITMMIRIAKEAIIVMKPILHLDWVTVFVWFDYIALLVKGDSLCCIRKGNGGILGSTEWIYAWQIDWLRARSSLRLENV
jgi:hypothetical protein